MYGTVAQGTVCGGQGDGSLVPVGGFLHIAKMLMNSHIVNGGIMKKPCLILAFLILISIFCGCGRKHYELSHTIKDVETLDIIYISPYEVASIEDLTQAEPIATIPDNDISLFLDELLRIPCHSQFMDPIQGISKYTVRIHYQDGSTEWICSISGRYYKNGKTKWKHLSFEEEAFDTLIEKVI